MILLARFFGLFSGKGKKVKILANNSGQRKFLEYYIWKFWEYLSMWTLFFQILLYFTFQISFRFKLFLIQATLLILFQINAVKSTYTDL